MANLLYGGFIVRTRLSLIAGIFSMAALMTSAVSGSASGQESDSNFCMDVDLGPFHMVPGYAESPGTCPVPDYWDGWLQENFYPFTIEDHPFNCDVFGDFTPLPPFGEVPSWVVSNGPISGTIGGHPFSTKLYCSSQTNWYPHFCEDPSPDGTTPCFQLAQPMLKMGMPFPRVTEVSIFDGVVTVPKGKRKTADVPIVMATRAAGMMHLESMEEVGATITHSLLGLVTYDADDEEIEPKVLTGSLDVLLQGHIFSPDPTAPDAGLAVIKGTICSKDLYKLLNKKAGRGRGDD